MKRQTVIIAAALSFMAAQAQTDAILRLRDERKKHPDICSVSFPGSTVWRQAYDAIYSHGAIIENPWVALRIYMNESQAVDVYLKQTAGLEARQTGFYTDSVDVAGGKGCDVLRVGKSIGAGSFRSYDGTKACDVAPVKRRSQTVVNDSTVDVSVEGWMVGGHPVQMRQRFTAHADRPEIDVEVLLDGYGPTDLFCSGVQRLDIDGSGVAFDNMAWSEGRNAPDSKRPWALESVRLKVVADKANVRGCADDGLNYLLLLRPDEEGKIRYTITAERP